MDTIIDGLTARPPDRKVYQRIAKKQNTYGWLRDRLAGTTDDSYYFHWCSSPNPQLLTQDTPAHVCDIWELSADQAPAEPTTPPEPKYQTLSQILERVSWTQEETSAEPVSVLNRANAIATLHQAMSLERIADALEDLLYCAKYSGILQDPDDDDEDEEDEDLEEDEDQDAHEDDTRV